MHYAGIGSRKAPEEVLAAFEWLAEELAKQGYILRSGGADGCDTAFEKGCEKAGGKMEIFLPWEEFNNNKSSLFKYENCEEAFELAKRYHPNWDACSKGGKALLARDGYQVLGLDLNTPSSFIICYTEDGKGEGGTGQALRIARDYDIKVCDFGRWPKEQAFARAEKILEYIKENYPIREKIASLRGKYGFLSNFYDAPIEYNGVVYKSSECAYQAEKCADEGEKAKFAEYDAKEAKKMSHRIKMRPDWPEVKLGIMREILYAKFTQHPNLAQKLLETGDLYIEEGNKWKDTYWGVCDGVGENNLGKLLMEIRANLREKEKILDIDESIDR